MEAIQQIWATAGKEYKNVKPNARQRRNKFLDKLILSYEKKDKDKVADKIRAISKAERVREAQQEVHYALKKTRRIKYFAH